MKRLLIPFAISLGLSLGVSTGFVVLRRPTPAAVSGAHDGAPAPSEKAHGDSAASDGPASVVDSTASHPTTDTAAAAGKSSAPTNTVAHHDGAAAGSGGSKALEPAAEQSEHTAQSLPLPVSKTGPVTPAIQHAQHSAEPDTGHVSYLAKTFTSMPSRTAAGVMMGMSDEDITVILASMNAKQRGAILGNFPSDRATKVARLMLHSAGAP